MSGEKDMFNSLLRDKLYDLEVPYNEAHWEEMSQKLDQTGPLSQPKHSWFTKTLIVAGTGAAVSLAAWLLWPENEPASFTPDMAAEEPSMQTDQVPAESGKTSAVVPGIHEANKSEITPQRQLSVQKNQQQTKSVEDKVNAYADRSEEKVRDDARKIVDNYVHDQKANMPSEPKINNPTLKTDILVRSNTFCVGEPVKFDVDQKRDGVSYFWDFGDKGLTSRNMSPEHTFNRTGTFEVLLLVTKNGVEKNNYQTYKTVTIQATPEIGLSIAQKELSLFDPYVEITASSNLPCEFMWVFDEKERASGKQASFYVDIKGSYPLELKAQSANGCISEKHEFYHADRGFKALVENTFTPNSDMTNPTFLPVELKNTKEPFLFVIRDPRNGNVVFESHDSHSEWNGNLNNSGSPLPEGNYIWQIIVKDVRGIERKQEGKILLTR